jgi:diguanylate cyclase (GGDEF)-like protein
MLSDLLQLLPASLRTGEKDAFPKELEEEYQQHIGGEKIRTIRLACLLTVVLTLPFAIVDIWALPNNLTLAWLTRIGCFVMALVFYRVTRLPQFLKWYTPIGVCLFLAVGLAIEFQVAISGRTDAARAIYSNGVLLPILAMYSLSFLSIRTTFSVSFAFVAVYTLIAFGLHDALRDGTLVTVLVNILLLASAAFIGLLSQIGRDGFERQAYLHRRALDNELLATEHARQLSEHFSNHDPLTGLANRKCFEASVSSLLRGYQEDVNDIAILFIDLDGFKPVNDRYGHAVGDKVLQVIGQRIVAGVSQDDHVARIGGDEFVLALNLKGDRFTTQGSVRIALSIAKRLVEEISSTIIVSSGQGNESVQVRVGASIGVALASKHARHPALLITLADQAMYQAKRSGKGAAFMAAPEPQALELETDSA